MAAQRPLGLALQSIPASPLSPNRRNGGGRRAQRIGVGDSGAAKADHPRQPAGVPRPASPSSALWTARTGPRAAQGSTSRRPGSPTPRSPWRGPTGPTSLRPLGSRGRVCRGPRSAAEHRTGASSPSSRSAPGPCRGPGRSGGGHRGGRSGGGHRGSQRSFAAC